MVSNSLIRLKFIWIVALEYLQVVRNGMASYNQSCADNIKEAFLELEQITEICYEGDEALDELNDMFQVGVD